jgi:hypothetical protein
MNPRTHTLLPLAALALLTSQIQAATVIANFTTDLLASGATGTARAEAYAGGIDFSNPSSAWAQNITSVGDPFTFRYNISGLGIGLADELLITVDTVGSSADLGPAAGNGIAVTGGANNDHWDPSDPSLSFTIVVEDASNNDITGSLTIDLTGVGLRWGAGATATFAGQGITQSATLQGVGLSTGQTAETFITASRTGSVSLVQVQQLRFEIAAVPEPSVALLLSFAGLPLLRRRREP